MSTAAPVPYEPIEPLRYRASAAPRASIVIRVTRDSDPESLAFWLETPGVSAWTRPTTTETARDAQKRAFRRRVLEALGDAITEKLFAEGEVTLALEGYR